LTYDKLDKLRIFPNQKSSPKFTLDFGLRSKSQTRFQIEPSPTYLFIFKAQQAQPSCWRAWLPDWAKKRFLATVSSTGLILETFVAQIWLFVTFGLHTS